MLTFKYYKDSCLCILRTLSDYAARESPKVRLYIANILTGWSEPIILHCPHPMCKCVYNRAVMVICLPLIILVS